MQAYSPPSDVGQTSDRQSSTGQEPAEVLREHREVLRKKLRLLMEGKLVESRTSKIDFRTWPDLKYVYGKAPQAVKAAARKAFESVILSWFLGEQEIEAALGRPGSVAVFNINIAEASADARACAKVKVNVKLVNELSELLNFLEWLAYQSDPRWYPQSIRQKAARFAKAVRDVLAALN